MAQDLYSRAMLVSLRISSWSAKKNDSRIADEVARQHGASKDLIDSKKRLLPADAKSYFALNTHIAATRKDLHYAQTLAWSDDGWRLLPVKNWQRYTDLMRQARHEYDSLLSTFLAEYPTLRENARIALNGLYRDSDYPVSLSGRYSWAIEYAPLPQAADFRLQLSEDEIAMIAQSTESRVKNALQDAQVDAVKRLFGCVARMHERLQDPKNIFRDTLIENCREICSALQNMNLMDDPQLDTLRAQTEILAYKDPKILRDDVDERLRTAQAAQDILNRMTAAFGGAICQ
jgi:hypothetical protein